ncbi:secretory phospholipase A2 receptor-like [Myxocyprinus asiaticus]|uniref:secretory phospholipase A2 receptor-like n=1 Tax=Myxocyprinus asiaticus TaxID=70543 RepID=UPI002223141E|nr:secretory phospholipase A2 receptor-like [Myxocyprinus asiaticus]
MKTTVTVLYFMSLFGLNSSFYVYHFYVTESMTWDGAQTYCRAHNDDLSTVSSQDLQQLSDNAQSNYWIGLQKLDNNKNLWEWSAGGMATINEWDRGEPDDYNQKCGFVKKSNSKLHDLWCSASLQFYCMEVYELILVQQTNTWEEALDYCRQHYIDLAIINSEIIMVEARNKTKSAQTEDVWTGLRFLAGHWFWVNGDDVDYTAWSVEGDFQCPAMNQRCGAIDRDNNDWKPTDCDQRLNFLCVKRANIN